MRYPDVLGYIYALSDPLDEVVRYVGRTKQPLPVRLNQHIEQARRKKDGQPKFTNPRMEWIRSILSEGRMPEIQLLEVTLIEHQRDVEAKWMAQFPNLVNSGSANQGGTRSYVSEWTPERLEKLGKVADSILAEEMGITRKAVTYKRKVLGIPASYDLSRMKPPPKMGGHNKIEMPKHLVELLGKMSDKDLGRYMGVSKYKIQRERIRRGIPSYAETTGNNGQYKAGNFPARWLSKELLNKQLKLGIEAVLS